MDSDVSARHALSPAASSLPRQLSGQPGRLRISRCAHARRRSGLGALPMVPALVATQQPVEFRRTQRARGGGPIDNTRAAE
jgi:hypothetical protein